jgi:nitroreductase
VPIDLDVLKALVDLARLSASGSNLQPLKFILSADPETNARIFPHTRWLVEARPGELAGHTGLGPVARMERGSARHSGK